MYCQIIEKPNMTGSCRVSLLTIRPFHARHGAQEKETVTLVDERRVLAAYVRCPPTRASGRAFILGKKRSLI